MPDSDDKPRDQVVRSNKTSRLSKFEGIIISRERVFDVLATIITAIFTVVLALSTVLLWKETKDLRNFAEQQSKDMRDSIKEATRAADAMRDVAKALAADAEAAHANLRAYITLELGGNRSVSAGSTTTYSWRKVIARLRQRITPPSSTCLIIPELRRTILPV